MIRHVDAFFGLRAAAGEIEEQMIPFLRQCEIDFPRIIGLNNAGVTPLTVRNLRDSLSQDRFGVMNHFRRDRTNEFRSVGLEHRLHSRFGDVVRRHLALEIEADHDRLPGHVDKCVKHIFSKLAPVHQLDSRYPNSLVADFRRAGRIAAR